MSSADTQSQSKKKESIPEILERASSAETDEAAREILTTLYELDKTFWVFDVADTLSPLLYWMILNRGRIDGKGNQVRIDRIKILLKMLSVRQINAKHVFGFHGSIRTTGSSSFGFTKRGLSLGSVDTEKLTALEYFKKYYSSIVNKSFLPLLDDAVGEEIYNKTHIDPTIRIMNLISAASKGLTDVVRALLAPRTGKPDIDVNMTDNDRWTALMWAAFNGHTDVVGALLSNTEIDVNMADNHGLTALMLAASKGHIEVLNALLSNPDIDVERGDIRGNTAVAWATSNNHHDIVSKIEEKIATRIARKHKGKKGGSLRKNKTKRRKNKTGKTIKKMKPVK